MNSRNMSKRRAQPPASKAENAGATLRRLSHYLRANLFLLVTGLTMVVLSAVASVATSAFLKPIINALLQEGAFNRFVRYLVILGLVFLFAALTGYLGAKLLGTLAQRTSYALRRELFAHLQELPVSFYDSHKHGDLMSSFTNDLDNINMALEQTLSNILTSALQFIGTFIMMLVISPLLTVLVVLMIGLMFFVVKTIGGKSANNFRAQQQALGAMNAYIEEIVDGQKVVKVFNHEEEAIEEFRQKNETLRVAAKDAQTYAVMMMPIMGNLSYMQLAITAMVGAIMVIRGTLDIGSLASFLQYSRSFGAPITQVANQMNLLIGAVAGAERVFRMLDIPIEEDEGDVELGSTVSGRENNCWRLPQADGSVKFIPLKGDIRLEAVDFAYEEGRKVLHDISLYARPGQKIALVGSTGAGKTTITNLLNRFYDIQEGRITYDGIDLKRIKKSSLRRTLGMVLQDIHLFEGSIKDNIRFGKLDATDEEVVAAAKIANAHSFIKHLPEGYDTLLTADGLNLSQGQRQLLSIARAAVADPVILVLDEATSSIDTRTERLIQIGMDKLMENRTTFSIAHRLSTVRHADAIMVLENGEIIERGDHDALMALRGRYYELNTGQLELS